MKPLFNQLLAGLILLALVGCSAPGPEPEPVIEEAPAPTRPEWTMNEPDVEGGVMSFVGLSNVHASEKNAREDARRNAGDAGVQYLGTLAKT